MNASKTYLIDSLPVGDVLVTPFFRSFKYVVLKISPNSSSIFKFDPKRRKKVQINLWIFSFIRFFTELRRWK